MDVGRDEVRLVVGWVVLLALLVPDLPHDHVVQRRRGQLFFAWLFCRFLCFFASSSRLIFGLLNFRVCEQIRKVVLDAPLKPMDLHGSLMVEDQRVKHLSDHRRILKIRELRLSQEVVLPLFTPDVFRFERRFDELYLVSDLGSEHLLLGRVDESLEPAIGAANIFKKFAHHQVRDLPVDRLSKDRLIEGELGPERRLSRGQECLRGSTFPYNRLLGVESCLQNFVFPQESQHNELLFLSQTSEKPPDVFAHDVGAPGEDNNFGFHAIDYGAFSHEVDEVLLCLGDLVRLLKHA